MIRPDEGMFGQITESTFPKQLPQDTEAVEAFANTDHAVYSSGGGKDAVTLSGATDLSQSDTVGFPRGKIQYTSGGTTHVDFPDALPLVGTNTTFLVDRSYRSQATAKHTLTFTGKILGLPANGITSAQQIFTAQKALRDRLRGNKIWHIRLTKDGGVLCEFANCKITSIDFPAGRYYNYSDYTITFESTDLALDDLETYSSSIDVSTVDGMGYFQAGNIISDKYYEAKMKLAGSSLDVIKAGEALNILSWSNNDQVMVAGDGRTFLVKNITRESLSTNPSTGEVSMDFSCDLVPNSVDQRFVVGMSTDLSRDSGGNGTIAVDGTLKALNPNSDAVNMFWVFQENIYNIIKTTPGLGPNEEVRNAVYPLDNYDSSKRGSETSYNLSYSMHDNTVTFSYSYDVAERHRITNTIVEKISIQTERPADVIASIPVMGKTSGPVLQSLNASSGGKKTMSVDAVFVRGKDWYTEYESFNQLLADETPQGDVGFRISLNDSWDRKDNIRQAQVEWIYSNSYLYPIAPNGFSTDYFILPEDKSSGYVVGTVGCVNMWEGGITTEYSLVNTEGGNAAQRAVNEKDGRIHPGYGAYHNDLFSITSGGQLTSEIVTPNYEQRKVYLIRVRCRVTRVRDNKRFEYYSVFRVLIGRVNEVAGVDQPMTHVAPPEVLMVSNTSVHAFVPTDTVIAKVELTDPDFMARGHDGDPYYQSSFVTSSNIADDMANRPYYYVSGGRHQDLFTIKGEYLVNTRVLNPETDDGGSVESPLTEYNIIITAVESDSSGFVERSSGKETHIYNRELDLTVLKANLNYE